MPAIEIDHGPVQEGADHRHPCYLIISVSWSDGTFRDSHIEAHQLFRPIDDGQVQEFDPARDLVPVCPTCHALIHRGRTTPLSIEELRRAMQHTLHQQLKLRLG